MFVKVFVRNLIFSPLSTERLRVTSSIPSYLEFSIFSRSLLFSSFVNASSSLKIAYDLFDEGCVMAVQIIIVSTEVLQKVSKFFLFAFLGIFNYSAKIMTKGNFQGEKLLHEIQFYISCLLLCLGRLNFQGFL